MSATLDHVHIYASHPLTSIAFYMDGLGAERLGALPTSNGRPNHLLLLGGQFLVVSGFPEGTSAGDPGRRDCPY